MGPATDRPLTLFAPLVYRGYLIHHRSTINPLIRTVSRQYNAWYQTYLQYDIQFNQYRVWEYNNNPAHNENNNAAAPNADSNNTNNIRVMNNEHAGSTNLHATQPAQTKKNYRNDCPQPKCTRPNKGHSARSCLTELLHGMLKQQSKLHCYRTPNRDTRALQTGI